ncbi:MAG: TonB-dependent receptor plug domain-containing protein, partial [Bacteroidales bacterium]|nr:TonB-dependent receptor plug domain-containing protein [Bacteroidales bacterium]
MLTISYIGMENVEVAARPNMRIILSDNREIDEVIVVAYGTQKRSSFTGAAATVKGEKIEKLQVSNLSKAFEGSVAGVQTTATSGTPGSSAKIRIRGIGSISSSQEPLIVVDGVPYEGSLNSIPAMDVENITVLKDAAANSMYGARGSNGVILVTTKGSKAGKAKINFDGRIGFNTRGVPAYDIITNPGEYYEMMYEAYRNSLLGSMSMADANAYAAQNLISKNLKYNAYKGIADNQILDPLTGKLNPNAHDLKWNDDWSKDPFDNGLRQEYNVNVQGGNENTQAYASLGYLSDEGYMVGSKFERISARIKVDQKINDNVKIGGNFFYANTIQDRFGDEDTNYSNIFQFSQMIAPIYPIYMYDADGNRIKDANGKDRYDFGTENQRPYASEQNPLAVAKENKNQVYRDNFSSRGYFQWNFLKDFKLTVNAAYDLFNTYENIFWTPIGGDAANVGGRSYKYNTRYAALNLNQLLDWNH